MNVKVIPASGNMIFGAMNGIEKGSQKFLIKNSKVSRKKHVFLNERKWS